jgi:acyl carrier protein phosphodiesterase
MNWLAHLYLSEPTPAFRLGNLLPDMVPATALAALPPEFQRGIRQHRQIDAFTDAHPIFRQSIHRLGPSFRRFGGVLIDIFYDHILAREWESLAPTSLPAFAADVYASFDLHWTDIPSDAHFRLQKMREIDWLCAYREIAGITEALTRIGEHLRRPVDLAAAIPLLERDYEAFRDDFRDFFPQLIAHVAPNSRALGCLNPQTAP